MRDFWAKPSSHSKTFLGILDPEIPRFVDSVGNKYSTNLTNIVQKVTNIVEKVTNIVEKVTNIM